MIIRGKKEIDPKLYFFSEILGGCYCGNSDDISNDVWEVFEAIAKNDNSFDLIYSDKYHELIAHMLSAADITEHGELIARSWLTKKGEELYNELVKYL